MKQQLGKKISIKNQTGFLTIDFIFAIVVSVAFSVILFVMCFTLSAAEIAQYIAFAVGRSYSAGHVNRDTQECLGSQKFAAITGDKIPVSGGCSNSAGKLPPFGKIFKQGWFILKPDTSRGTALKSGYNRDQFDEYNKTGEEKRLINSGVRLVFITNLFNLKLGFLGSTNSSGETFSAKVTGLMLRNPTQDECQLYMKKRHAAILNLDSRYKANDKAPGSNPKYVPMEDNGC